MEVIITSEDRKTLRIIDLGEKVRLITSQSIIEINKEELKKAINAL